MMKEMRYGGIKVAICKIQLLLAGPAHDMLMHVNLLFLPAPSGETILHRVQLNKIQTGEIICVSVNFNNSSLVLIINRTAFT